MMNKVNILLSNILLSIVLATGTQTAFADDNASSMSFWDFLRSKIESLTPKKKVTATTATGGVRGAQVVSEDVYWKGESQPQTVDQDELDAFKKALAFAYSGDDKKAQAAFSDFVKKYPDSILRKDADQALAHYKP